MRKGFGELKVDAAAAPYPNMKLGLAKPCRLFKILIIVRRRQECRGLMGYCAIASPKGVIFLWLSSAFNAIKECSASTKLSWLGGVGKGNSDCNIIRKSKNQKK
jgi:hypothetical protein